MFLGSLKGLGSAVKLSREGFRIRVAKPAGGWQKKKWVYENKVNHKLRAFMTDLHSPVRCHRCVSIIRGRHCRFSDHCGRTWQTITVKKWMEMS